MMQRLPLPDAIPDGIEIWLISLDFEMPISRSDMALLSEGERIHALKFLKHEDRIRSIATRASLRRILASHVMVPPNKLQIIRNPYGKPRLDGITRIEFNVSHSGHFSLIAIATNEHVIGIDIERLDHQANERDLCRYIYSPLEHRIPLNTSRDFIERWVAKEAVLKALGLGIAEHLQAISILPADDDESYQIIHNNPAWKEMKAWPLKVPDGYAAAVAVGFYPGDVSLISLE